MDLPMTDLSSATTVCECSRCLDKSGARVEIFPGHFVPMSGARMVLCAICENKRCPHAADHRNSCTDSNEPGQPGSNYDQLQPPDAATLWGAIRNVSSWRQLKSADKSAGAGNHVSNEHYMSQEIDSLREVLLLALALLRVNVPAELNDAHAPDERTGDVAGDAATSTT
jgi:hypothetical protein